MIRRDVIAIGASAGSVEALTALVKSLPADLAASIFVVLHIPPYSPSSIPEILTRAGPLKASHPTDGAKVERSRIYVGPPDHHLLVENERILIRRDPKENRFRPSIDALFRSVAYSYRTRVIGVVLSGVLDDGTSGLWTIKRLGGAAVVQEPDDALYPDMPQSVLNELEADEVVPVSKMGELLARLTTTVVPDSVDVSSEDLKKPALEIEIAMRDDAFRRGIMHWGEFSPFTCPECHGSLVKITEGKFSR